MPPRNVNLFYSAGCWSYVGRTGNSQVINLGSAGCWTQGIVAHEIGKLFGLVSVYSFFFYYYYYCFPCVLSSSFCLLGVFTGCFSCCFSYTFSLFLLRSVFIFICIYFRNVISYKRLRTSSTDISKDLAKF